MEDYSDESVQKKVKKIKIVKKTAKIILTTFMVIIILLNLMILLKKHMEPNTTPDILGYKAFAISAETKNENLGINDGDLIIVNKNTQVNVNDIVVYKSEDGIIKSDKVLDKKIEGSKLEYLIKEGETEEQNVYVGRNQVEGIYTSKIAGAGGIGLFFSNIWVSVALLLLIIAMQFDSIKLENRKKLRQQKRLNYENRKCRKESM